MPLESCQLIPIIGEDINTVYYILANFLQSNQSFFKFGRAYTPYKINYIPSKYVHSDSIESRIKYHCNYLNNKTPLSFIIVDTSFLSETIMLRIFGLLDRYINVIIFIVGDSCSYDLREPNQYKPMMWKEINSFRYNYTIETREEIWTQSTLVLRKLFSKFGNYENGLIKIINSYLADKYNGVRVRGVKSQNTKKQ